MQNGLNSWKALLIQKTIEFNTAVFKEEFAEHLVGLIDDFIAELAEVVEDIAEANIDATEEMSLDEQIKALDSNIVHDTSLLDDYNKLINEGL